MSITSESGDPDHSEVIALMREARIKSRGHADYWEWAPDRRRAEAEAARVLREFLVRSGEPVAGQLSNIAADPPDVLLETLSGRRIGVEVTDLVDSAAVKRCRYLKQNGLPIVYDCTDWTPS